MATNDFYYSNNNTIIIGLKNKNLSEVIIPEGVEEIIIEKDNNAPASIPKGFESG